MKTLIIDGNSIGWAAHYATKLTSGDMQTQAVFGFLKTMRDLRQTYRDHSILVLWDGRAQWRFDLLPTYKSTRDNDPKKAAIKKAYTEQTPYIKDALAALGVRQMRAVNQEADDMAGYMVATLSKNPENEIQLITGDEDWLQLVRPNVGWRDHRNDAKIINAGNFYDKTGYKTPLAFLEGKCLQGDGSDDVPGVGGIGEKGAPEFLAEFGSVRNFWVQCDSGAFVPKKKAHIRLASAEGRQIFGRNLRMMQLMKVAKPNKEDMEIRTDSFNQEKFTAICEELAFNSILKNMDVFVRPFAN